jgi:N-acetyl-anhydromuramyl-L-alanine amidase AmpD
VHLLNIYVPVYSKANGRPPVWSGHFYEGQQVFWGYHWLMRMDGSFERLLEDNQIGWHAGNWEVNRRSIAICLDNDYEQRNPRKKVLQDLAVFIKQNYPNIKAENIIGHKEARAGTICPGKNFVNVWKPELLEYLSDGS